MSLPIAHASRYPVATASKASASPKAGRKGRAASAAKLPDHYETSIDADRIDSDAQKVIHRLRRHGYDAYLVGGGVRDLLLGRAPKDYDIATNARPGQVRSLFRNCRVIGRRFRLAHVIFSGGKVIEVATFRRDPAAKTPALHTPQSRKAQGDLLIRNDNCFGEPADDARRRDFTINGLYYDLEGHRVVDYVGGVPDLKRRLVRMIGDPTRRICEDPIRILRAIKFSARLDLGIDSQLFEAMVTHRHELEKAARPRILEEILRLMRGGAAHRSMYLMWDTGLLAIVLPELASYLDDDAPEAQATWSRLQAIDARHAAGTPAPDSVLLATLLWGPVYEALEGTTDPGLGYEEFMQEPTARLAIPRKIKERVRNILVAQRRLQQGRERGLRNRDFYKDAKFLETIDQAAQQSAC